MNHHENDTFDSALGGLISQILPFDLEPEPARNIRFGEITHLTGYYALAILVFMS